LINLEMPLNPGPVKFNHLESRQTLGNHLTELLEEAPERVFIARRINSLRFHSQQVLEQHFSKYGTVTKVLVAHSRVKSYRVPRIRPGSLGFIVMGSADSVQAILSLGREQMVGGHIITVEPFVPPQDGPPMGCDGASTATGRGYDDGSDNSSGECAPQGSGSTGSTGLGEEPFEESEST
jgi:hypothetical protein